MKSNKLVNLLFIGLSSLFPSVSLLADNQTNLVDTLAQAPILATFDGQYQYLSKLYYQGPEKPRQPRSVVVLNFMGLNCPPCKKEMPLFFEVVRSSVETGAKAGNSIRYFLISIDPLSSKEELRSFLEEQKVNINTEVLLDPYQKAAEKFSVVGIPRTFVISAEGWITADISGNVPDYKKLLINGIATALSKKVSP